MKKMMVVVAALSLAFIGACGGGDGGGGGGGSTTACGTETQGCIAGNVVDAGTGLWSSLYPAVTLSVNGGPAVTANADGWFFTKEIAQGASIPVCFSAANYVTRCRNIAVTGGQTLQITPTQLMPMTAGDTKDTSAAATFTDLGTTSANVVTAPGDFCDASGTAVAGNVTCHITPLDVSARQAAVPANNLSLAPGSFTGSQADGSTVQLVSGGMMDIYCTDDATGARLQVCAGKTPNVQIPIYDTACADNTKYPSPMQSWGFNEATGKWDPVANFNKTCGGSVTNSYYTGTITHLSYWNADKVMESTCVTGKVTSDGTAAVQGARVSCTGTDYNGESETYTGADGTFCALVMTGGAYACVAQKGAFVSDPIVGTASATAAQCGGEGCTDIGIFTLKDPLMRTVLTWGVSPSDLDSHFASSGDDIYFGNKDINPHGNDLLVGKGTLSGAPFIELDVDDTSSYGPEVTTVVPGVVASTYRFCVHNYSGQSSGPIEASGATVNVISTAFNKAYAVPTSNPGNADVWRVYQVVINTDNTMSFTDLNDYVSSEGVGVAAACLQ